MRILQIPTVKHFRKKHQQNKYFVLCESIILNNRVEKLNNQVP